MIMDPDEAFTNLVRQAYLETYGGDGWAIDQPGMLGTVVVCLQVSHPDAESSITVLSGSRLAGLGLLNDALEDLDGMREEMG